MFADSDGRTWQAERVLLTAAQQQEGAWNEWDAAELGAGRFLCVFRRTDPDNRRQQVRWQGILLQREGKWVIEDYRPAPFVHSGHPELLRAREHLILHIATTGTHWTADEGKRWQALKIANQDASYQSRYYPRSLQAADGTIFVFSHVGSDNAYGERDQSIVMDTFRLISE
jgi:hypothetical protein